MGLFERFKKSPQPPGRDPRLPQCLAELRDPDWRTRKRAAEVLGGLGVGADEVVAVADGAVWIQGLVDHHRPDAVRILDFAHAAESVCEVSKAAYGDGTEQASAWFERQRHRLRHEDPSRVLEAIKRARGRAAARWPISSTKIAGATRMRW